MSLNRILRPLSAGLIAAVMLMTFSDVARSAAVVVSTPQQSSARILVIDAGHGGADGGAVSPTGLAESAINLDIALRMLSLCQLLGVECVMTRTSEELEYPAGADTIREKKVADQNARVELVNSTENAVLISIHQNISSVSYARGPQVLYGFADGSAELGAAVHAALSAALYPENRRVASPISDTIYLFKNISCPAILVECAFLSNPEEEALLQTDGYKLKTAAAVVAAYRRYI